MTPRVQAILSKLRRQLAEVYGARLARVVLYGSHAREEAEEGSDIDVLVALKGDVRPAAEIARTGEVVAALSLAENVVISCAFVSELRLEAERSPFLMNVRREGVTL